MKSNAWHGASLRSSVNFTDWKRRSRLTSRSVYTHVQKSTRDRANRPRWRVPSFGGRIQGLSCLRSSSSSQLVVLRTCRSTIGDLSLGLASGTLCHCTPPLPLFFNFSRIVLTDCAHSSLEGTNKKQGCYKSGRTRVQVRLKLINIYTRCKLAPASVIPIALVVFWTYNDFRLNSLSRCDVQNMPEKIPVTKTARCVWLNSICSVSVLNDSGSWPCRGLTWLAECRTLLWQPCKTC